MKLMLDRKYSCQKRESKIIVFSAVFISFLFLFSVNLTFAETEEIEEAAETVQGSTESLLEKGGVLGADLIPANPQSEEKTVFYYEIEPGKTINDYLVAVNHSDKENLIRIYLTNAYINDKGETHYTLEEDERKEVSQWVKLAEQKITLEPDKNKKVNFSITVPEDTPYGIYEGGFAIQKIIEAQYGGALNSAFRKIEKIKLNVTENPKLLVKRPVLAFQPTIYFWVALGFFALSILYYFVSTRKNRKKSKK